MTDAATRSSEIEAGTVDCVTQPSLENVASFKQNPNLVVVDLPRSRTTTSPSTRPKPISASTTRECGKQSHMRSTGRAWSSGLLRLRGPDLWTALPRRPAIQLGSRGYNQYDPDKAKSLLKAAGKKSLSFTVWTQPFEAQESLLQAIAGNLQEVGISMNVLVQQTVDFFPEPPKSQAFMFEWLFDDPISIIGFVLSLPTAKYTGPSPASRKATTQYFSAPTASASVAAARAMQLAIAKELPIIPLMTPNQVWVHNKKVHGLEPTATMIYPRWNDVWVEA